MPLMEPCRACLPHTGAAAAGPRAADQRQQQHGVRQRPLRLRLRTYACPTPIARPFGCCSQKALPSSAVVSYRNPGSFSLLGCIPAGCSVLPCLQRSIPCMLAAGVTEMDTSMPLSLLAQSSGHGTVSSHTTESSRSNNRLAWARRSPGSLPNGSTGTSASTNRDIGTNVSF